MRRLAPVGAGLALGSAAVLVAAVDPVSWGIPLCPLNALTGLHCPGCGGMRATHQLLTGDLGAALALNPFVFVVLPLIAWAFLAWASPASGGPRLPPARLPRPVGVGLLVLLAAFTVLRNVPVHPLTALAP